MFRHRKSNRHSSAFMDLHKSVKSKIEENYFVLNKVLARFRKLEILVNI